MAKIESGLARMRTFEHVDQSELMKVCSRLMIAFAIKAGGGVLVCQIYSEVCHFMKSLILHSI